MPSILTFGEILFDDLPAGRRPGGGPFNTAAHLVALGNSAGQITAVGDDENGRSLRQIALDCGVDTRFFQVNSLPTGIVTVSLDEHNEASYEIVKPVAWDAIEQLRDFALIAELRKIDAFAFWLLGVRSEKSLQSLLYVLDRLNPTCLKAVDLGLRAPHFTPSTIRTLLQHASIVKLNAEEMGEIASLLDADADPEAFANQFNIETLLVTNGPKPALSYRNGAVERAETPQVDVVDTVGCGDAFFAGYLHARLQGNSEKRCLEAACARGAYAATQAGGLPQY